MALTITLQEDPSTKGEHFVIGDRRAVIGTIQFDSSYPTGGELVTPADFDFWNQIDTILFSVPVAGTRLVAWDQASKKIKVFTAIGTEAANSSDQSSVVVPFVAIGK